ncbi:hypothetical protein RYX36_026233 [Vicia faba]
MALGSRSESSLKWLLHCKFIDYGVYKVTKMKKEGYCGFPVVNIEIAVLEEEDEATRNERS